MAQAPAPDLGEPTSMTAGTIGAICWQLCSMAQDGMITDPALVDLALSDWPAQKWGASFRERPLISAVCPLVPNIRP